jgi:hypothetical protein
MTANTPGFTPEKSLDPNFYFNFYNALSPIEAVFNLMACLNPDIAMAGRLTHKQSQIAEAISYYANAVDTSATQGLFEMLKLLEANNIARPKDNPKFDALVLHLGTTGHIMKRISRIYRDGLAKALTVGHVKAESTKGREIKVAPPTVDANTLFAPRNIATQLLDAYYATHPTQQNMLIVMLKHIGRAFPSDDVMTPRTLAARRHEALTQIIELHQLAKDQHALNGTSRQHPPARRLRRLLPAKIAQRRHPDAPAMDDRRTGRPTFTQWLHKSHTTPLYFKNPNKYKRKVAYFSAYPPTNYGRARATQPRSHAIA